MVTRSAAQRGGPPATTPPRGRSAAWSGLLIGLLVTGLTLSLYRLMGVMGVAVGAGALLLLSVLAWVSMRDLSLALIIWLVSMSGLRHIGMVHMPILPDFSIDRLMLMWVMLIFWLRWAIQGRPLKRPLAAEILLLVHMLYLLYLVSQVDFTRFHEWVLSSLSPLFAFIFGKNVISTQREIRNLMLLFFVLTIYYYITAIAERAGLEAMIWPKEILDKTLGFYTPGRSRGPFLHPPLFGQVMGMLLLVHFFLLVNLRSLLARVLMYASLGLSLLGVFFSYTRGPWLATTVGLLTLGALRTRYRRMLAGMAIVAVLVLAVGIINPAQDEFAKKRFETTNTIENRLGFMANAIEMIKDNLVFGVGYFQFMNRLHEYSHSVNVPFYGFVKRSLGDEVPIHDIYIGRLAEEGLISSLMQFAFYALILRAFVRKWRRNYKTPWFNNELLAVFAGIMVCYLVGGMVIDYRYFDFINVVFYLLAGIIYGYRPEDEPGAAVPGAAAAG